VAYEELIQRYQAGGGRLAKARAEGLAVPPALKTALITCMDSRINTYTLFGLKLGEVHVLRNAGGVVTDDMIRSLAISQRKLGTREILLMQHGGCGLATFSDDDFSETLADETGMWPSWRTHAFRDPVVSVRRGMAQLRHDPFLMRGTRVRGFVVDIETFDLQEVFVEEGVRSVRRTATPAAGIPVGQIPGEDSETSAGAHGRGAEVSEPSEVRQAAAGG
jgi:carbonic anhydrase